MDAETAGLIRSLREQLDRLTALVRTLLEMSNLQSVSRTDQMCIRDRWMPVQTARPRWRHWQQSGTTLYCWTSTCPRWTECRLSLIHI